MKKEIMGVLVVFLLVFAISFVVAEDNETMCDSDNLDLCLNETDCLNVSGVWENDSCIEEEVLEDNETCDLNNLNLCLTEDECEIVNGEWANDSCIEEIEDDDDLNETEEENETEDDDEEMDDGISCEAIRLERVCIQRNKCGWDEEFGTCARIEKVMAKYGNKSAVKQRVLNYLNATDCPTDCNCSGSTVKCDVNGTRVMIVVTGSGNIIIQTKEVNASTSVELIKKEDGIYANLTNKEIKMILMPDKAWEKVKDKINVEECEEDCEIELDESGKYQMQIKRHSKILGIFNKKMKINAEVDLESGDVKVVKPWWAFIASEPAE
jgi:hypothetical protein